MVRTHLTSFIAAQAYAAAAPYEMFFPRERSQSGGWCAASMPLLPPRNSELSGYRQKLLRAAGTDVIRSTATRSKICYRAMTAKYEHSYLRLRSFTPNPWQALLPSDSS